MASTYLRNSYNIHGKKIIFAALTLLLCCNVGHAQINRRFSDLRTIHFGFTLGSNYSRFKYAISENFYYQDTFTKIRSVGYPGFTLGAVANLHFGLGSKFLKQHLDLRLIPTLVLSTRRVYYTTHNAANEEFEIFREVESALVQAPLLIKLKSDRHVNMRYYVIGGVNYSYDLASNAKAKQNPSDPKLAVYPNNVSMEYGFGFDFYFPYFKFSPEIKLSKGMRDILVKDNSIYSGVFSSFKSNFLYISLYFEG